MLNSVLYLLHHRVYIIMQTMLHSTIHTYIIKPSQAAESMERVHLMRVEGLVITILEE